MTNRKKFFALVATVLAFSLPTSFAASAQPPTSQSAEMSASLSAESDHTTSYTGNPYQKLYGTKDADEKSGDSSSDDKNTDSKSGDSSSDDKNTDSKSNGSDSDDKNTDSKSDDSSSDDKNTDSKSDDSSSDDKNTDSKSNDSGSDDKNTDSKSNDSGSDDKNTDDKSDDSDSDDKNTDSKSNDSGSDDKNTDSKSDDSSSDDKNTDSQSDGSGSDDKNTDDKSDDSSSDDKNTDSEPEEKPDDLEGHWAKGYILALHDLDVINPSASDGTYQPDRKLTRAEFMRYINRAFAFTEKADIDFEDVEKDDWYYETVQIAVAYGYINGVSETRMAPGSTLTREQAAVILGRLHKYTPIGSADSLPFSDKSAISDWSVGYIADAVEKGYINGYTNGTFQPQGLITRGQIAKMLYYFLGSSLREKDNWYVEEDLNKETKNVSISAPCSLADVKISGNLYITEGLDTGSVSLSNVTVEGDLIISGGDVMMDGVGAKRMIIANPLGVEPDITCIGNSNIAKTELQSSASLNESTLTVSASGMSDLTLTNEDIELTLDGQFWTVTAEEAASILTSGSTTIHTIVANARVSVTGGGEVDNAVLNVSGCEFLMEPASYEIANGVTATLAGRAVVAENNVSVTPSTLNVDLGNPAILSSSYDFTFNADNADLEKVMYNTTELKEGSEYTLLTNKNGIRLAKRFLTSLKTNTCTLQLLFQNGDKGEITISSEAASTGLLNTNELFFDRYTGSPNYMDQKLKVTLPTGVQLNNVKLSSVILERGKDYNYNSATGELVLLRETLAQKTTGTYTISFVPNRGSSMTCSLTVTDTSPKNEITPNEADFDANAVSGSYADITVKLEAVNKATLKSISCGSKKLEEDWQYRIDGDQVTISKSAIASFASKRTEYADFTFVMSSGRSPVLRVNYVTTIPLSATITDDLGLPIANVPITFSPVDAEGSTEQTVVTNEDGTARVYVKRGSYLVSANDNRFSKPASQTISTNNTNSVKLVGEILESVTITVTNSFGAKLSGATVSIGGQSVTTGADGAASFTVKHSNYTIQVSCPGYQTKTQAITVDQTVQARVILD